MPMAPIADQFHFVNKTAQSASLTHSESDEKFYIQSYVHSKSRKKRQHPKQAVSQGSTRDLAPRPSEPVKDIVVLEKHPQLRKRQIQNVPDKAATSMPDGPGNTLSQLVPTDNGIDPFHCTPVAIDACTHRLLQYPFSGFVEMTFTAESLSPPIQASSSPSKFRHAEAVAKRLRLCIHDEIMMYATLAYCSSSIRFAKGNTGEDHPPEFYILKTIQVLRSRLQRPDPVDSWLIMSIYALSISEMWANNHEASATHLTIIRHFIAYIGGMSHLEPYVMESLILGDKYLTLGYLAQGKLVRPILPLDWDPSIKPPAYAEKLQYKTCPKLSQLASTLVQLDQEIVSQELQAVVVDLVAVIQIAHSFWGLPKKTSSDERWLFLRHQALIYRLLSIQSPSVIQECVRIAILIFILKATHYFGAQRCSGYLLPQLKNTLLLLPFQVVYLNSELLFWITCVGATVVTETAERDWFVQQTARFATYLQLETDAEQYEMILNKYLILDSEQQQIEKLVLTISEMQKVGLEVQNSD